MKRFFESKYFFAIVLLLAIYWGVAYKLYQTPNQIAPSTFITTSTALIGAVTFWMQLRRNQRLNESSFIMNLNNQFITNKELTYIEHTLELYFDAVRNGANPETTNLNLDMDRSTPDYQNLVNYLVYLEALSAIVQQNTLHLGVIDDLFAYRFFIAVNNPIVQKHELLPFADYYQGCFKLSKKWSKKMGKRLPLSDSKLHECPKELYNKPYKIKSEESLDEKN